MRNQKNLKNFLLMSAALLSGFLCHKVAYGSDIPKTPETLFKEIIKKLEAKDMKNVAKHFLPSQANKDALAKMKPSGRKKFIAGLKKARFARKINHENVVFIVPYESEKEKLDLEMTVMKMPDGQWIVVTW